MRIVPASGTSTVAAPALRLSFVAYDAISKSALSFKYERFV
jgi:hypothetical protein